MHYQVAFGARMQDVELEPELAGRRLRVFERASALGLVGLTRSPMMVAAGTNSRRSSSRFGATSAFKVVTPVRLPPGRFRLPTRPSLTGSKPTKNTIGIVLVAALAAIAAGPFATITLT